MNKLIRQVITRPHYKIEIFHIDLCAIKLATDRYLDAIDPEERPLIEKVTTKWEAYKVAVSLHGIEVKLKTKLTLSILEINLLKWALHEQVLKYQRDLEAFHQGKYKPNEYEGNPFPEAQKKRIVNTLKVVQKITI